MAKKKKSVNQDMADTLLQHNHYLLATEQHVLKKMRPALSTALKDVKKTLKTKGTNLATLSNQKLAALEGQLSDLMKAGVGRSEAVLRKNLAAIINAENTAITGIMRDTIPFPVDSLIDSKRLPLEQVGQIIDKPLKGETLGTRFTTLKAGAGGAVRQSLQTSVILGESYHKAAKRIQQVIQGETYWKAARIVRTEVHRVAVDTQMASYNQHKKLLNGVEYTSTLDDRTCVQCAILDGVVYYYPPVPRGAAPIGDLQTPPVHPNCRCTVLAVTKSWEALGFTKKDLKAFPGLVAMTGKNPNVLDYNGWFNKQPKNVQLKILGAKRFKNWKAGKFSFKSASTAVSKNLKPLAPKALANLRGLGKNSKPRKAPLLSAPTFKPKDVRDVMSRAMIASGMSRKEAAGMWRGIRSDMSKGYNDTGWRVDSGFKNRHMPKIMSARMKNLTSAEGYHLMNSTLRDVQINSMKELRTLVNEATAFTGKRLTQEQMATHLLLGTAADAKVLGLSAVKARNLTTMVEGMAQGSVARANGMDMIYKQVPSGKRIQVMTMTGNRAFAVSSTPALNGNWGMFDDLQNGIKTYRPSDKIMAKAGLVHGSVSIPNARFMPTINNMSARKAVSDAAVGRALVQREMAAKSYAHEVGHILESQNPAVKKAAADLLAKRTAGAPLERLSTITGVSYKRTEMAKRGGFATGYTGKIYPSGNTEITAMATQHMPAIMNPEQIKAQHRGYTTDTLGAGVADATSWALIDQQHVAYLLNLLTGTTQF